jgi:hypothetical protein
VSSYGPAAGREIVTSGQDDPTSSGERVETCWRLRTTSGRAYECSVFRRSTWFDVRLVTENETVVYSQVAISLESARKVAALWRRALARHGDVEDVSGQ